MKVLILTDIHSDDLPAKIACEQEKPDLVLDCGDRKDLKNVAGLVPHYYVRGNHEPCEVYFNGDDFPLPHEIDPRQIYGFSVGKEILRFSGTGGNYSTKDSLHSISERDLYFLRCINAGSLDVLLLHEPPFNYSGEGANKRLAKSVIEEIDRINPRMVFSGHIGFYKEYKTPGGIVVYALPDVGIGYGILNISEGDLKFRRVISRYIGNSPKKNRGTN